MRDGLRKRKYSRHLDASESMQLKAIGRDVIQALFKVETNYIRLYIHISFLLSIYLLHIFTIYYMYII